jgi:phenylalanyl-tRNA synthetase alpha chain
MLDLDKLRHIIKDIRSSFLADIREVKDDIADLTNIRNKYMSRKGMLPAIYMEIVKLPLEDRREAGILLKEVKSQMENLVKHREIRLPYDDNVVYPDISMPPSGASVGSLHPVTLTLLHIENFFSTRGFSCYDNTRELDTIYNNFDSLNILETHPSRSLSDTFYVGHNHVLRTQTSSAQHSILTNFVPPFRYLIPGNVYRRDSDMTHTPMFTQVEGLLVEPGLNYQYLLHMIKSFILNFFGSDVEMRIRPSYFPFTSPSAEVDIMQDGSWVEVLGCGVVHPKVIAHSKNLPLGYSGLAFGMGVERLTMLKYGLKNLRTLYLNDLRFLQQFSSQSKYEI